MFDEVYILFHFNVMLMSVEHETMLFDRNIGFSLYGATKVQRKR